MMRPIAIALIGSIAAMGWMALHSNDASAQLYQSESGVQAKPDGTTWNIAVKELERLPRISVVEITTTGRPQSVGGSITIGCKIVELARARGWRYVAQAPAKQSMGASVQKQGGLEKLSDDPAKILGDDFAGADAKKTMDVENFGAFCDLLSKQAAPAV